MHQEVYSDLAFMLYFLQSEIGTVEYKQFANCLLTIKLTLYE